MRNEIWPTPAPRPGTVSALEIFRRDRMVRSIIQFKLLGGDRHSEYLNWLMVECGRKRQRRIVPAIEQRMPWRYHY